MAARHALRLHEEILLLALHDEKGTAAFGSTHGLGMGGALLAELLLEERIEITDEGRHGLVTPRDPKPLGDPLLDECITRVRTAKRRASPSTWVSRFGQMRDLLHRVAQGLVQRGLLRETEGRVLLVFTRRTYPTLDPAPERALMERLRTAIFTDAEPDERTAILIALANASGLLAALLGRHEVKARKQHIDRISSGAAVGRATRRAVEAVQTAVATAAAMTTIMAASS